MDNVKHLGLRIDPETHRKLKYIVEFEGRSINGEVLYLIRQAIAEHERKHGKIVFDDAPSSQTSQKNIPQKSNIK